jgi:hypothetical protein
MLVTVIRSVGGKARLWHAIATFKFHAYVPSIPSVTHISNFSIFSISQAVHFVSIVPFLILSILDCNTLINRSALTSLDPLTAPQIADPTVESFSKLAEAV